MVKERVMGEAPAPASPLTDDAPERGAHLRVLFLGAARALAAREERLVLVGGAPLTLAALSDLLYAEHPALRELKPTLRWAVNGSFEPHAGRPLAAGDTVALVPPFSGG